jgi:hypothetical protein
MLKWSLLTIGSLIALAGVAALVGYCLPRDHRASRSAEFAVPAPTLFAAIIDIRRFPEWRSDLKKVEILSGEGNGTVFREHGRNGVVTFRIEQLDPNVKLVTRIADPSLPFGGTWTQELQSTSTGTRLTITEDGEVYNPIFRLMSALIFSPYATIDAYIADLRRHAGT